MTVKSILSELHRAALLGHVYLTMAELFAALFQTCGLSRAEFRHLLEQASASGEVFVVGDRVYLRALKVAEDCVAQGVQDALSRGSTTCSQHTVSIAGFPVHLNRDQLAAITMANSHRLSMVIGGAGTGKSTLIQALFKSMPDPSKCLVCAPTGKAASNLKEHGIRASTVHRALRVAMNGDFLQPLYLPEVEMIVIDEASMAFKCMLNRNLLYTALTRAKKQVILVGDLEALDYAMQTLPPARNSGLVEAVSRNWMSHAG